ncbi:MAG: hypothetical protein ACR2NZ_16345, partial [Rubripirellula sp.]
MYEEAMAKPFSQRAMFISAQHQQASLQPASNQDRKVHELLTSRPMPMLLDVYQEIFEKILGQRVSRAAPRLAEASQRLNLAKRTGRPLLFVLHDGHTYSGQTFSTNAQKLIDEFIVIVMPIREAPALSQLTDQPPYESNGAARPLFVVAESNCKQIASVSGHSEPRLMQVLAQGWAGALEKNPPSVRALVRAQRLLRPLDETAAKRVKELTIRVQAKAKAERDQQTVSRSEWIPNSAI